MARAVVSVKPNLQRRRMILLFICVVLFMTLFGGVFLKQYAEAKMISKFNMTTGEKLPLDGSYSLEAFGIDPKVDRDLKNYRNILLIGVDTRAGEKDNNCRSDANIIVSINKTTNEVRLISVLRDSYFDMEENGNWTLDKLTHAHAYGGPMNTIRSINRNMDLNIHEYVRVNWSSVVNIVDSIGGIDVNIEKHTIKEMNKYIKDTNKSLKGDKTKITKAGKQTLNGVQAVTFCRIRKCDHSSVFCGVLCLRNIFRNQKEHAR